MSSPEVSLTKMQLSKRSEVKISCPRDREGSNQRGSNRIDIAVSFTANHLSNGEGQKRLIHIGYGHKTRSKNELNHPTGVFPILYF